jgi:plastocyanin
MTTLNTTPESASITMVSIVVGSSVPTIGQFYQPGNVNSTVGSKVNWVINDTAPHTTTSGTVKNNRSTPTDAFDSTLKNSGDSFPFIFNKAGEYAYYCTTHPWMTGKVTIS